MSALDQGSATTAFDQEAPQPTRRPKLTPAQRARMTELRRQARAAAVKDGRCGVCVTRPCRAGLRTCDVCLGVGGVMSRSFNVCCQAVGFHRVGCKEAHDQR